MARFSAPRAQSSNGRPSRSSSATTTPVPGSQPGRTRSRSNTASMSGSPSRIPAPGASSMARV